MKTKAGIRKYEGPCERSISMGLAKNKIGRGNRIWTCGLCVPNATLYQTEPCPAPIVDIPIIFQLRLNINNLFKNTSAGRM